MANDIIQRSVATGACERLNAPNRQPRKVYTFRSQMTGELPIVADNAQDAYRQAILKSPADLAEIADLEMDGPEEAGVIQ